MNRVLISGTYRSIMEQTSDTSKKPSGYILVVEDNRTQAEYLRYILDKEGYEVRLAPNGMEALEIIKKENPFLILTDVMMPEMDGYELCKTIKNSDKTASIPVILVTHLFDPVDVLKGLEVGADNFIIKPYTPECINSGINSVLVVKKTHMNEEKPCLLKVFYTEKPYYISASRMQIVNILLSTYEIAIKNNSELQVAQEQLHYLNEQMQKALSDLQQTNRELAIENHERQLVETALGNANKKLQLMASITRHDLLNQLNSLQGYLELATMDRESNVELAWDYIGKASEILKRTVNTVRFTGEYQEIGIKSPIWEECREILSRSVGHTSLHGITVINDFPKGLLIYADPLIEKVFSNLIENAVRYGGKISSVRFSFLQDKDISKIICEDDGRGISDEEKDKIFLFQYGKNTGQGLFLSKEILAITGITIEETGIPDKGARFEIICPIGTIRMKNPE